MSSSNSSSRAEAERDEAIGELDDAFFANARVRKGGTVVREATGTITRRGRPPMAVGERKEAVSLRLSPKVLAHFRAAGGGWQTRIDDALQELVTGTDPSGSPMAQGSSAAGRRSVELAGAEIVVHGDGGRIVTMETSSAKSAVFSSRKEAVDAARKAGKGGWVILKDAKTGKFALLGESPSRARKRKTA